MKPRAARWVPAAHILKTEVGASKFLSESSWISATLQDIVCRKSDNAA